MGTRSIQLMTNNPRKVATLERLGVKIEGRIPCIAANLFNQGYLEAKEGRMKHSDGACATGTTRGTPSTRTTRPRAAKAAARSRVNPPRRRSNFKIDIIDATDP